MRAGDHIAPNIPTVFHEQDGSTFIGFRLRQSLPEDAKAPLRSYIKLFAKDNGWDVTPNLQRFMIGLEVKGSYESRASRRNSRRSYPCR